MSPTKMDKRSLKCTVLLEIKSVTCPGLLLKNQSDIYISVCILGQYRKTACVHPEFPLHFHQKMIFEKIFPGVVDPADVADLLEADTTYFELIQVVPPEGVILATLKERTIEFLYPGPECKSRETLMKRTHSFPGISPKVDFSTTSVIQESSAGDRQPTSPSKASPLRASPGSLGKMSSSSKPIRHSSRQSPTSEDNGNSAASKRDQEVQAKVLNGSQIARQKQKKRPPAEGSSDPGYLQPTVSSRSRALSPYTHRRMCELSEDTRQRLGHLQLGPHTFKKSSSSSNNQPPFSVPWSTEASLSSPSSPQDGPHGSVSQRCVTFKEEHTDASLLGSYRPRSDRMEPGYMRTQSSPGTSSRHEAHPKSSAESSLNVSKSEPTASRLR